MKVTLVGMEHVSYDRKKDDKHVEGLSLYVVKEPTAAELSRCVGKLTDKIWIDINQKNLVELSRSLQVPCDVDLIYGLNGRYAVLEDIKILDKGGLKS